MHNYTYGWHQSFCCRSAGRAHRHISAIPRCTKTTSTSSLAPRIASSATHRHQPFMVPHAPQMKDHKALLICLPHRSTPENNSTQDRCSSAPPLQFPIPYRAYNNGTAMFPSVIMENSETMRKESTARILIIWHETRMSDVRPQTTVV